MSILMENGLFKCTPTIVDTTVSISQHLITVRSYNEGAQQEVHLFTVACEASPKLPVGTQKVTLT